MILSKKCSFKILLAKFENKFNTNGSGLTFTKAIQIIFNLF